MNRIERNEICRKFFLIYGVLSDKEISELLGANYRSIHRYRLGDAIPNLALTTKMKELSSESEFEERLDNKLEEIRLKRQEKRVKAELVVFDSGIKKPRWYEKACEGLEKKHFEGVYFLLKNIIESEDLWNNIEKKIKIRAFEKLAISCHCTGRTIEAQEAIDNAMELDSKLEEPLLSKTIYNLASTIYLRMGHIEKANSFAEKSVSIDNRFYPAYYNGLCVGSVSQDAERTSSWSGGLIAILPDLEDNVLDRLERVFNDKEDDDIKWACKKGLTDKLLTSISKEKERRSSRREISYA